MRSQGERVRQWILAAHGKDLNKQNRTTTDWPDLASDSGVQLWNS